MCGSVRLLYLLTYFEPRGKRGMGRLPEALGGAHVRERRVRLGHPALLGRARAARLPGELFRALLYLSIYLSI